MANPLLRLQAAVSSQKAYWTMTNGKRADAQLIEAVHPSSGWKISGVAEPEQGR